jgi:lysophospholipase L1-like esterase
VERRLKYARALLAALLLAAIPACGGADGGGERPLRVLFVGNSLTATNDLPAAVGALAAEAARRPLETRTVAPGGVSLEEHWRSTGARQALEEGPWDAVVLQQGPSTLPESRAHLRRWTRRWADEVRAHGARPALLEAWPEAERRDAFPAAIASHAAAAAAADVTLLPVAAAWHAAWRRDPGLELYGPDGFHPSELGTQLAALVVYAGLTGADPEELPLDDDVTPVVRAAAGEALAPTG